MFYYMHTNNQRKLQKIGIFDMTFDMTFNKGPEGLFMETLKIETTSDTISELDY